MSDMRLIDGYQKESQIIVNGNYLRAMSSSRFTGNKNQQNESQDSSNI